MSYPPPPGISSLPARPPASNSSNKSSFKPAFAFTPSSVAKQQSAPKPTYSAPSYYSAPSQPAQHGSSSSYGAVSAAAAPYSYGQQPQSYNAAPQIQNPFPAPGTASNQHPAIAAAAAGPAFDPEMAAQIAQWQSAYVTPDGAAGPGAAGPTKPDFHQQSADAPHERTKTVMREGGGKKWQDDTLLEWDPAHLRLFVGNLAGETTDESLLKAFSRWTSVQKARVIRDKRTNKSKGYGFVSFSDADDYFQAAKEMNGKYIQSHPVTVRKANTEIKVSNVKDKHHGKKKGHHGNNHQGGGSKQGAKTGAGVTKPGQKTKNGLKLLG